MSDAPAERVAVSGFPVFFDGADAGLPPERYTTFVTPYSRREGYRTGYAYEAGTHTVKVGGVPFTVRVSQYAPRRPAVPVRAGTTEDQLAAMIAENGDDTDYAWDAGATVTLTKVLPVRARNVRWLNAKLDLRPATHASVVYIDVLAPGFRVENLAASANLAWAWDKAHRGTCDVFHVSGGGSLVCRPAGAGGRVTAAGLDTFCWVSRGAAGVVLEAPELTNTREYLLYQNGSDAGTSVVRAKVDAHGYEPFVRIHDYPDDAAVAGNVYVGLCEFRRRDPAPLGKDGVAPRGCRRVAIDSNKLFRCQVRSGHDEQGIADGGKDPQDVLVVGNTVEDSYLHHKEGNWSARRIHVLRNTVVKPYKDKPILYDGVTDGTVADNCWQGGPAEWKPLTVPPPKGPRLTNCRVAGNGNVVVPFVDPDAEKRARIAAMNAELSGIAARRASVAASVAQLAADDRALAVRQAALADERARLLGQVG